MKDSFLMQSTFILFKIGINFFIVLFYFRTIVTHMPELEISSRVHIKISLSFEHYLYTIYYS